MVKSTDLEGVSRHSELQIASFWRRITADVIDLALLLLIFLLLALLFPDYFFSIGPGGRIFSFGISVGYFGLFGSRHGRGQTLGKWIMGLAVVDAQGKYLLKRRSFTRAAILFTILTISGWALPPFTTSTVGLIFQWTIFIGGMLAIAYSYLFNVETRQGPHDLVVDAYVALAPPKNGLPAPYRPRIHEHMTAALFGVGAAIVSIGYILLNQGIIDSRLEGIRDLQHTLSTDDRFFVVEVSYSQTEDRLMVKGWYREEKCTPEICDRLIWELAYKTLTTYRPINDIGTLEILIYNKIDLNLSFRVDVEDYNVRYLSVQQTSPQVWRTTLSEDKLAEGNALLENQNHLAAIEAYTQAVEIAPTFASAYYNRGLAHEVQGDYQQAIEDFTRAVALDGRLVNAYGVRGRVFYTIGNYQQALDDLRLYKSYVGDDIPPDLQSLLDILENRES